MTAKIFIDGAVGTTGLEIRERLARRSDLTVVALPDAARKDEAARARALNDADLVILCLPDEASRQAVSLIENPRVRVIDASTAFRVAEGWTYGFPELEADGYDKSGVDGVQRRWLQVEGPSGVGKSSLVRAGLIPAVLPVTVHGVSGYSGGGKSMIEEFEKKDSPVFVETVHRGYALGLGHKHLPEMQARAGLNHPPLFAPTVARFYRGMLVELPLQTWALPGGPGPRDIHAVIANAYAAKPLVEVAGLDEAASMKAVDAELLAGSNRMKLFVFANKAGDQVRLVAALDILGKGAGGAAVQNLNIMLGLPETTGL